MPAVCKGGNLVEAIPATFQLRRDLLVDKADAVDFDYVLDAILMIQLDLQAKFERLVDIAVEIRLDRLVVYGNRKLP